VELNDYPIEWWAAAAILAGLCAPHLKDFDVFTSHRYVPPLEPPLEPPLPFEPLLTYVKLRPIGLKWNARIGRLVDADE